MKKLSLLIIFLIFGYFALNASFTYAQEFKFIQPLTDEYNREVGRGDIPTVVNAVLGMILGLATALAVVMIVIGGFIYATAADSESRKSEGKEKIQDAVLGLLLLFGSYLLLYTINPQLVSLNLAVQQTGGGGQTQTDGGTPPPPPPPPGGVLDSRNPHGSYNPCKECTPISDNIPVKTEGLGACYGGRDSCEINRDLHLKLTRFVGNVPTGWEFTEGWPPTVTHSNFCHSEGTCGDIAMRGLSSNPKTAENTLIDFESELRGVGLKGVYEVPTVDRAAQLSKLGKSVIVVPGVKEHWSVYNCSAMSRASAVCN